MSHKRLNRILSMVMVIGLLFFSFGVYSNCLFYNNTLVYAEEDTQTETGTGSGTTTTDTTTTTTTTPKLTGDPKQILTDPSYDLNLVDPAVLKAWYESAVSIPDSALNKALQNATGLSTVTVQSMLGLSGNLDLSNLGITSLNGMEYAINIKRISMSHNSVVSLDPLKNLSYLEYLDYSYNNVKMIPSWIFTLPNLTSVNGSNNASTAMQQASTDSSALVELYLENNALTTITEISFCTRLTTLSLSGNSLAVFPTTLLSLPKLSTLFLTSNKLTEVPNLAAMTNLSVLYLDKNLLTKVPEGLENMTNLQQLALSCNTIEEIPDTISKIPNLTTLLIYGNDIKVLPESLLDLKLNVLDIGLNDIDLTANETMIKKLEEKIQNFYYKLQKPNFELTLVEDKNAPGGKLVWSGVSDMKADNEGSYTISKIVVERKEETITDDSSSDNNSDDDVINNDSKPVISVYEQIAELEANKTEYIDEKADSKTNYTYKVTVYIKGKYMDNYEFEISGFKTVNTKDMIKQNNTKLIIIIAGSVVLAALIAVGVIFFLKKKKKGGSNASKLNQKRSRKKKGGLKRTGSNKKKSDKNDSDDDNAAVAQDLDDVESIDDIKRILEECQKNADMNQQDVQADDLDEPKEIKPVKKEIKHDKKRRSIISDWEDDDDIEAELNKIIYNDDDDNFK